MLSVKQQVFICGLTMSLGYMTLYITKLHQEKRIEPLLLAKRAVEGVSHNSQSPSKEELHKMIREIPHKSFDDKIRDAVNAAHRTHDEGFPWSNNKGAKKSIDTPPTK